ncbi:FkbM family methyltransferase [Parvibaculum sp.]|uniref:FkbM family methyltransferase n=1 Tax=Parvibaculum sp. TaxID=2024848 RepID=UPI001B18A82B|nr:FkbM family methyltransferase [Parvibaculum sp.]MBO6634926.1 FkbM family methyltransferase [Parvibaculum sp.]MBO6678741.1 FkbM family methyltransferase [Parvibaculum sp.]MBO6686416.1 FkbM family methyltransferase [Parvibaculum sp.]MBO6906291.1 FkbM family methyltransferase [Parvibaculum sp.]
MVGDNDPTPVVDTLYGPLCLPPNPRDLIRRVLESEGEWAYLEALLLKPLLGPESAAFDVGAFVGTFSLALAGFGVGRVVSVEPNPVSASLLKRNMARNCTVPYEVVQAAVGLHAGRAVVTRSIEENLGGTAYSANDEVDSREPVEQVTIADLRRAHGSYDLLKLDVEGGEFDALRSDAVWIRDNKPLVWAECNEKAGVAKILEFMIWAGLSPVYVAFPVFRKNSFRSSPEKPFPQAYEAALAGGPTGLYDRLTANGLGEDIMVKRIRNFADLRQAMWHTPRWSRAAWQDLSPAELTALLGRSLRGESFETFLLEDKASDT